MAELLEACGVWRGGVLVLLASGVPLLLIAVLGLLLSILQAATQIQEQTLSIIPKLGLLLLLIVAGGPWMAAELIDYFTAVLEGLPALAQSWRSVL